MTWSDSFPWTLGATALAAVIVAVAGGVLTETGPWYRALKKPSWKPPDWAFGPVWTVILVLAAISAALALEAATEPGARMKVLTVLVVTSVLNIAWSGIFFKMKRPDWALVEVVVFWFSILALIVVLGGQSALAGWLMAPYLAWVTVATFLNYRIVRMNGPFG